GVAAGVDGAGRARDLPGAPLRMAAASLGVAGRPPLGNAAAERRAGRSPADARLRGACPEDDPAGTPPHTHGEPDREADGSGHEDVTGVEEEVAGSRTIPQDNVSVA